MAVLIHHFSYPFRQISYYKQLTTSLLIFLLSHHVVSWASPQQIYFKLTLT